MALSPRYRSKDAELLFSNAYALTVTTATYSSELDLGGADMGAGSHVDVVVYVSSITATAASTLDIVVAAGTATSPTTTVLTIPTVTGSAAFEKIVTLPREVARYVRLKYTLGGTAASSATITAFATARPVG